MTGLGARGRTAKLKKLTSLDCDGSMALFSASVFMSLLVSGSSVWLLRLQENHEYPFDSERFLVFLGMLSFMRSSASF
ncbi:hypothetical protein E2C01_003818 [Portunus trituberculatus]|uniref:Uncharacterized protein n=1 Tax=Portunus trituberculatus TaxID=210409 RepID=A0A5B7CNP7_PORTR|nr:hypothetical protein [Portunus trituberculatus]